MNHIAGVVILYHPDEKVLDRIKSYVQYLGKLYVVDNTEVPNELIKASRLKNSVIYLHDGENNGIAVRLNEVANLAIQEGFKWLLTMDQDSCFDNNLFLNYYDCCLNFPYINQTAMFGVQYHDKGLLNTSCNPYPAIHLITSGSILNLALFLKIGPFDEALFIDKVDHEYCLRAQLLGYRIIRMENIFLNHNLGKITYGRSLKNFKITPRVIHSPIRMYYIVRNYLYLKSKFKGHYQESFAEMNEEVRVRLKNNLLYGENKLLLLKYIIKAYKDYKTKRFGKMKK